MTKSLTTRRSSLPTTISAKAREYASASKAENTKRAYTSALKTFSAWCAQRAARELPADPATVAEYLTDQAAGGASLSTVEVHRAAISSAHELANQPDPTASAEVKAIMAGIRRTIGRRPAKKAPVTPGDLRALVAALPDTLAGKRDRALLLVGFAGAFRRSELTALDVADLRINGELKVTLQRSKTDQEGHGQVKTIPTVPDAALDPVQAMRTWLNTAGIKSGPVFRQIDRWGHLRDARLTPQSVALLIKRAAQAAGLEPRQFAGHSLRSGFITAAASAGSQEWEIQEQTGHRSTAVLRGYIRDAGRGAKRAVLAAFTDSNDN